MAPVETSAPINRRRFMAAAAGTLAGGLGIATHAQQAGRTRLADLPVEGRLPRFAGATGWINSAALAPADLRGKFVLVQFWTYTCINWLRAHPYVRAWSEKYKDQGLVVVGVHTPEFPFEGDIENVRRAACDMQIGYPIAVDSDHTVWRAFDNQYWPAFYIIDALGRIRHHQFGEGGYAQSELVIQRLLEEAGARGIAREAVPVAGRGAEAAADWANLKSLETYVGYEQAENFSSPGGAIRGKRRRYAVPPRLPLNHWALSGDWTIEGGLAALDAAEGRIAYRFHARDLHLVMGAQARPVRFRVTIDGAPPRTDHGSDIDAEGRGTAQEPRLYQLVRQYGAVADRTFEITFLDAGIRAYAFTFG